MKIPQTKRYSIYKSLVLMDSRSTKLNFTPDGREHYVYRVTDLERTTKEHYYGSHTPRKGKKYNNLIDEFWTYGTSSKCNDILAENKEIIKLKLSKCLIMRETKFVMKLFYINILMLNHIVDFGIIATKHLLDSILQVYVLHSKNILKNLKAK